MTGYRKKKPSPPGEQFNLWDESPACIKKKSVDINQASFTPDNAQKQDERGSLSQELVDIKKKFSRLHNQLKKEKVRNDENERAYLCKLVAHLPALMLFEVLKVTSLKETKEMIKPLKPTAGMAISTNRSIREMGTIIGLSPAKTKATLQLLFKTGFVKQRGLGVLELGEFSQDKKGRIFPLWYRDINNPEHIMLLFSLKDTLSNYKAERF